MALNLDGLTPLDTSGLTEVSDLDVTGLQELDTSGLRELDAESFLDEQQPQNEDSWLDVGKKVVQNAPTMLKQAGAGMLQMVAESGAPERFPGDIDPFAEEDQRQQVAQLRAAGAVPGQQAYAEAAQDLQANAPNVDPESLKGYAYDITQGFIQMLPTITATIATRKPMVGGAIIGGQVGGQRYGESREAGRDPGQAVMDSAFYTAAEGIPEAIPLGIMIKRGEKFLPRTLKTAAAEGVQEMFTQILQTGYDMGILNEDMTWGEAINEVKRAGIVGTGVGTVMGAGSHPIVRAVERAEDAAKQPTAAEVTKFATQRVQELNKAQLTPKERQERDFLQQNASDPQAIARAYGVELAPETDTAANDNAIRPDLPPPTPEDIASPIPTGLIQEGKALVDNALAGKPAVPMQKTNVVIGSGGKTQTVQMDVTPPRAKPAALEESGVEFLETPPAVVEPEPEQELVDEEDDIERLRADIAGETPERASLMVLSDYLDRATDVMNGEELPGIDNSDALSLKQRIDEAMESGEDLAEIQQEAVSTIRDWLKNPGTYSIVPGQISPEIQGLQELADRISTQIALPPGEAAAAELDVTGLEPVAAESALDAPQSESARLRKEAADIDLSAAYADDQAAARKEREEADRLRKRADEIERGESSQPSVNGDLEQSAPQAVDASEDERAFAEKAEQILDLQKNPTGWKGIPHPNREGMTLISEDGKKSVTFRSRDTKSGTESQRTMAKAQAYAIDNPYQSAGKQTGEPQLKVEDYTDKSIIIRGKTRENMERIKEAGKKIGIRPLWNKRATGWVFPKSREKDVREALADLVGGKAAAPAQLDITGLQEVQPPRGPRVIVNVLDMKAEKARQDAEDQQKAKPREGKVGDMLSPGEVVLTVTGRQTTPFPKIDTATSRKATGTVKRVDEWLMQNALDEARSRGDEFNARQFEGNLNSPSQADKDSAELYLFDKDSISPPRKSILKPLNEAKAVAEESQREDTQRDIYDRRIEGMSPEEIRKYIGELRTELLKDERTGLGSNKAWLRAWNNGEIKRFIASVDLDGLGWYNDHMGHPVGDDIIKLVGDAFIAAGLDGDSFHISGDEFYAMGDNRQELEDALERAKEWLVEQQVEGEGYTAKGFGLSYGVAEYTGDRRATLNEAEVALHADKQFRESTGERAPKTQRPPGVNETAQVPQRQRAESNRQEAPAARESKGPERSQPDEGQRDSDTGDSGLTGDGEPQRIAAFFALQFSSGKSFPSITDARKAAEGLLGRKIYTGTVDSKMLEEGIELGAVVRARQIVEKGGTPQEIYQQLVDLYGMMPSLSVRTSTSIAEQAYSTPVPLAYLASRLAGITKKTSVLEPTAGNGALLIEASPKKAQVNELNPDRAAALTSLGFRVTQQDASEGGLRHAGYPVDVVIANPPFGTVKDDNGQSRRFQVNEQYSTGEIDHAIALKALESMKDDGSAVLIVGSVSKLAKSEDARSDAYNGKAKREFYLTLYRDYNVVDHFTVSGELYEKQGAGWPVDVIVIRGRGKSEKPLPAVSPPRQYDSWKDLSEVLNARYQDAPRTAGAENRGSDRSAPGKRAVSGDGGNRNRSGGRGADRNGGSEVREPAAVRERPVVPESDDTGSTEPEQGDATESAGGEQPARRARPAPVAGENLRQVGYQPASKSESMGTLVPVNMQTAVQDALDKLRARVGDIDTYVAGKLGYKTKELGKYFGAEQVDAIALGIDNMERPAGFIIGDQTGIGKGRVVAAMIRYAIRGGRVPIFVTEKPNLYGDIYRDIVDIGGIDDSGRLPKILMTNAAQTVPLDEAGTVLKTGSAAAHNELLKQMTAEGKLDGYDMVFTTYSQMQTLKGEITPRMSFLERIGKGGVVILDESHNAGGSLQQGQDEERFKKQEMNRATFARNLSRSAHGVFYSSATYAKRPEVMDLYATTDMRLAVADINNLAAAIQKGGVPMQQVVASMLAASGQYIRRERSFDGITYNSPVVSVARETYSGYCRALDAIQKFSEGYIKGAVKRMDKQLKAEGKSISADGATGGAGATSTNFTSIMHNLIDQMLLSIKADVAADRAIEAIKNGEKPVITVANTMGSFIADYVDDMGIKPGDRVDLTFNKLLNRYLERTRWISMRKPFMKKGDSAEKKYLTDEELGPSGVAAFEAARELINSLDLSKMPVSPIDHIRMRIQTAVLKDGYKIGEITGRGVTLDYRPDGTYYKVRPGKEVSIAGRRKTISDFNSGILDAMIINQAGSTGLSLHASKTFKDQRKRRMIIAQPEKNIDTHMQMLGRVNRTGQVVVPEYDQLVADVPAEKRPAAVLSKKMASLNANTTASRGGALMAEDVPDFMNQYGDEVAARVMGDMPEIHNALGAPLADDEAGYAVPDAMRKVTGRIPLLPIDQQEMVYEILEGEYKALIEQKEAAGESVLEAKTLDLDAKVQERRLVVAPTKGDSPFADGVYIETVDVKRLGRPHPAAKVIEMVSESAGFKGQASVENMGPLQEAGRAATAEIYRNAGRELDAYRVEVLDAMESPESRKAASAKLDGNQARFKSLLSIGLIGSQIKLMTEAGNLYGVVTKIQRTGKAKNPIALGAWKMTIALADATRQITLPMSQLYTKDTQPNNPAQSDIIIDRATKITADMTVMEAFDRMQSKARETRTIVTGNILAGFDHVKGRGAIINFTDSDGNVRQGILMSRDFDYDEQQAELPVDFRTAEQVLAFVERGHTVHSSDDSLTVNRIGERIRFEVAASKARGGRYYLDKGILAALGSDFVKAADKMRADVPRDRATAVLEEMKRAGAGFRAINNLPVAREIAGSVGSKERTEDDGESPDPQAAGKFQLRDDAPDAWIYKFWGSRTWASEQDAKEMIRRRMTEDNERYAGMFPPSDTSLVDGLIFVRAKGGTVKLKQHKKRGPGPQWTDERPEDAELPAVDWDATDNQDKGTPASVMKEFGRDGRGRIYRAWVPLDEIPKPRGEDITDGLLDEDSGSRHDLSIRHSDGPPPAKIKIGPRGKIEIMDGNHRIAWWNEQGFSYIPAYVIDERTATPEPSPSYLLRDEFAKDSSKITSSLAVRLEKMGISDKVALELRDRIQAVVDGKASEADGRYLHGVIEIALSAADTVRTLNHEAIHALRDMGLFRDAEWRSLEKAAKADEELVKKVRDRYKVGDEGTILEEAIAEMYADWAANRSEPIGFVKRAFERIRDFFLSLRGALTSREYSTLEDIFAAVERGEVGRRELPRDEKGQFASPDNPHYALRPGDFKMPEQPKKPIRRGPVPSFENPKSEERWQDARKGIVGSETLLDRLKERLSYIADGFTRHFVHLPNTAQFSEAREQLRKLEAAPQAAKEDAVRKLRSIVEGMTREDLDLFTRKVVLDDLTYEADIEHELPFGLTPESVKTELDKINEALADRQDLLDKVKARSKLVKQLADDMVEAGVLDRERLKNPAYFRHQVLEYAKLQQAVYVKGTGKKLKTPKWAKRMGSSMDINANLLEAEFEWMQKALMDISTANTIEWLKKSDYNIRNDVIAAGKAHNQKLIDKILAKDLLDNGYVKSSGRETSPLNEEWIGFKQRIAMGLGKVREAIESGDLDDIPREFSRVASSLASGEESEHSLFPFLTWILDNDKPGAMGAGQTFKAISQRKAWLKAILGEQYADPMNLEDLVKRFAPKGYVTWQPEDGKLLFTVKTIPEHVIDRMMAKIAAEGAGSISAEELMGAFQSIRSMLAVGGLKYQMVLPEELAASLNSLRDEHADGLFEALFSVPMAMWKRWVLINPRRVLKYNLNNLSGDLDAIIAGNPSAVKKLPQAISELWQVMVKGETPSDRYREAVERGVFDSGLSAQEIPDINFLSEFESLMSPAKFTKEPARFVLSPFVKVWRALNKYTQFRENWMRYAAYLDYVERLESGQGMSEVGYGASRREMVDAIEDQKDKAALLARDLVGDYGAISHFGKGIRRKVIPFYSWMEINTKRYWRLGINAWDQGIGQGFRATGMIGATIGVRTTAYLTLRMAALYAAVQLWNNLLFGDEEDELSVEDRTRLHIILGRDDSGQIRTLKFQGALSDYLGWIGFADAVGVISDIEKGRAEFTELLTTVLKAPVNKVLTSLTPVITVPVELLSGKTYWPDVFNPRAIQDKWRHVAKLFSVENEYDAIFDRPSRGYGRSITEAVLYKRDVGETTYNQMRGMAYDWERRETGQTGAGTYQTPRSKALHDWRLAKKYGDREAERKAYRRMEELGVDNEALKSSVRNAHPLGSIPIKDRAAFLSTLTAEERRKLDEAIEWYEATYID